MNCQQVEHRLSEYLDKSLDAASSSKVESHLSCCDRCRAEADGILECIRLIAALSQGEPPIGFAQRVIAHVKEIESKPSFWESLFFPVKLNLPIQATALILIGIIAVYIAEQEPHKKLIVPMRQIFAVADKEKQSVSSRATKEPTRLFEENTTPADETSRAGKNPTLESDQKRDASAVAPPAEAASRRQRASHSQQQARANVPAPGPQSRLSSGPASGVAPRPLEPEASIPTPGKGQSSRKRKVTATIPIVSNPQGLSPTYSAPAPRDLLDLVGVGTLGSTALPSEFHRLSVAADVELILRRRPYESNQSRENVEALPKSEEANVRREQTGRSIESLLSHVRESTNRQTIWLTLPYAQYERFKTELLSVGTIESESGKLGSDIASAANTATQLRLMLLVLPADDDGTARPEGPSR